MSKNQLVDYYTNQAGSGIKGYSGIRYQRGNGWLSRILSSTILPLGKFLGKKALKAGVNIGSDLLKGENFKNSMKKQLKSTGLEVAEEALERVRNYKQTGSGIKRRRFKKKSIKISRKRRKPSLAQLRALAKGRKSLNLKRANKKRNKFVSSSLF